MSDLDEAIRALNALPNFRISCASDICVRDLEKILENAAKQIEELEERIAIMAEGGWISVEKRLPESVCDCIVACYRESCLAHCTYDSDGAITFYTPDTYEAEKIEGVTHWMPMPEAPKEGERDG